MRLAFLLVGLSACTFARANPLDALESGGKATCSTDSTELSDVKAMSAGEHHACAVRAAGAVVCWGRNDTGETGQAKAIPRTTPSVVRVGQAQTAVYAGGTHTCSRAADGTFTCWGNKGFGQMGDGLPRTFDETPPTTFLAAGSPFVGTQCAAGMLNTYLVKGGAVYATGSNDFGQLGLDPSNAPDKVVLVAGVTGDKVVSHGTAKFACAVGADAVACWGFNDRNELGVATTTFCGAGTGCSWQPVQPLPKAFKHPARDVAVGAHHACALDATGALFCWGVADAGQTGDTSTLPATWAVHSVPAMPVGHKLAAGVSHTCVVTESSEVWCMGSNADGELGPTVPLIASGGSPVPRKVPNLAGVSELAAGDGFTCAVSCGRVRCWGRNADGQLGAATVSADGFAHVGAP